MPRISQFFGVIIAVYYRDHAPPHFHAIYQENEALIAIETLEVLRGSLPRRAMGLVLEWAFAHRDELRLNWEKAQSGKPVEPIQPLE